MADYTKPSKEPKVEDKEVPKEKRKLEKAIAGTAKVKKENGFSRLLKVFMAEDITNIREVIIWDVVVPSIRDTLFKSINNGAHILFYGEPEAPKSSLAAPRVSYNNYYDRGKQAPQRERVNNLRPELPRTVTVDTREDAENILYELSAMIDDYGMASVLDMKDVVGEPTKSTDNAYGWTSVENATIKRNRDGTYDLNLPRPMPFD